MHFNIRDHTHRRLNILTGEWVLVSPHRNKRPWKGRVEDPGIVSNKFYDETCYLCPGNTRADGVRNDIFKGVHVFTNDFSTLKSDTPDGKYNEDGLIQAASESGVCRVITFSERHDLTLPRLSTIEIANVIRVWQAEFKMLSAQHKIKSIQIFENKGDIMGCSNPHPHGQIWAQTSVPGEIIKETSRQKEYYEQKNKSLLADYLDLELSLKDRIVFSDDHFVVLVPFWAIWPFETLIISRRHIQSISQFLNDEVKSLAQVLKRLTTRYDNIFSSSFPYSAGIHQAPVNDGNHPEWHWHMHFYPPLLRSASIRKFMVGYEMLADPQRDVTPEWAAEKLRESSEMHHLDLTTNRIPEDAPET